MVVANRIPWSFPNKIPAVTLLHPHEGVSPALAWTIKSNQVAMVDQTVNHGYYHLGSGKNGAHLENSRLVVMIRLRRS